MGKYSAVKIRKDANSLIVFDLISERPYSGEELASRVGLTRKAVWKMIKKFREYGIVVEADKRSGYRIIRKPKLNPFDVAAIAFKNLRELVDEVWYYKMVDSTNDAAKRHRKPSILFFAEVQTSGRGRLGRTWSSGPGGLYFTITLQPKIGLEEVPKITLLTGLSVAKAVNGKIKWPNDVLIENKKVCGILCEVQGEMERPLVIIGVGINVENELPRDLEGAGRLVDFSNYDVISVFNSVLKNFYEHYLKFERGEWEHLRKEIIELCSTIGKNVRIQLPSGKIEGFATDISKEGALVVDGKKIFAGDCIHLR
ncbi:biotin--[acetyl-CoA-carboxylase] ligase [Archaeoglobales archaeon]|nr:MAG: biotin--[acetyl-CoA-carboxylase] ligase [Archaeoglobales archaeon]